VKCIYFAFIECRQIRLQIDYIIIPIAQSSRESFFFEFERIEPLLEAGSRQTLCNRRDEAF